MECKGREIISYLNEFKSVQAVLGKNKTRVPLKNKGQQGGESSG